MGVPNKTNLFIKFIKPLVPVELRNRLRKSHQKRVFTKAIQQFRVFYNEIEKHPKIIDNLIYGWGNMGWSSFQDYTYAIINAAKETKGPVLECGSGLSTIIMGIIADDKGYEIYTLEHHESWADHIRKSLSDLNIKSVRVYHLPLKDYGSFQWYETNPLSELENISLVICDGPPHDTKGGRFGLFPLMNKSFADRALILLDDYSRQEEQSIVSQWQNDFRIDVSKNGNNDIYARIIFNKAT
jgi:Methyltransferase domain